MAAYGALFHLGHPSVIIPAGLHGAVLALLLCGLLFIEETGIPLPLISGDLLLVSAGLFIAGGRLSLWSFLPLAILATTLGALVGHGWTRLLGETGLRKLAAHFRLGRHLDSLARRLHAWGAPGITLCRLIPGLRINTTLVAGAVGVERGRFLLGVFPAIVLWIVGFTTLGALAGAPVLHLLGRVDHLALRGAVLALLGLAAYLAARHIPALPDRDGTLHPAPARGRLVLAAAIDLLAIASVVAGLDAVAHALLHVERIDGWSDAITTISLTGLAYLALARGASGLTAGEALFRITYRARSRRRLSPALAASEQHPPHHA